MEQAAWAAGILQLVREGRHPELAWLDDGAGAGPSFLGVTPDLVLEDDDGGLLGQVEALWREEPEAVWIGWVTYDLAASVLRGQPPRRGVMPGVVARRFPTALRWQDGEVRVVGEPGRGAEVLAEVRAASSRAAAGVPPWPFAPLRSGVGEAEYLARVKRAKQFITAGDSYQVNLSHLLTAKALEAEFDLAGLAADAYANLRANSPASLGALMVSPHGYVLSNSPELLVSVQANAEGDWHARTLPIKGSRPRGSTPEEDRAWATELQASAKDAAEHVMIVDLLRNDLGRLAKAGTVQAPREPQLYTLPYMHHLVSEITAVIPQEVSLAELLWAMMPGGSVTGAPKRRTVEIIHELEGEPRELYCGAVFLLSREGLRVSLPIRTALLDEAGLRVRAGGGIVEASDELSEWHETLAKVRPFNGNNRVTT